MALNIIRVVTADGGLNQRRGFAAACHPHRSKVAGRFKRLVRRFRRCVGVLGPI